MLTKYVRVVAQPLLHSVYILWIVLSYVDVKSPKSRRWVRQSCWSYIYLRSRISFNFSLVWYASFPVGRKNHFNCGSSYDIVGGHTSLGNLFRKWKTGNVAPLANYFRVGWILTIIHPYKPYKGRSLILTSVKSTVHLINTLCGPTTPWSFASTNNESQILSSCWSHQARTCFLSGQELKSWFLALQYMIMFARRVWQ